MVSSQESTWGKSVNVTPFRGRDRTFVRIVTVQSDSDPLSLSNLTKMNP